MNGRRSILLAIVLSSLGLAAWAQTADVDKIAAQLEKRSASVKQISDRIDTGDVPEATLEDDPQTLLGYRDDIQNDAKALKDATDEPSRRLDDLGAPPADGEPAESADIAKLRKDLEDQVTRLSGLSKEADLLFERPIKVGDWVVVPSGEGYVKNIGARATQIQTFDRASILIPNSELVTSAVQNWFYKSRLGRVRVDVGVSYDSDPERVRDILLDCAKQHPTVSSFPATSVRWTDFGDSSLNFQLRAYVRNIDDSYTVRSDLRFAIFKAFKSAGVEIPFPQRDLHVRSDDGPVGGSTEQGRDVEAGE